MCRDVELARGEERWYHERLGDIGSIYNGEIEVIYYTHKHKEK
jgi:hypothetical protein